MQMCQCMLLSKMKTKFISVQKNFLSIQNDDQALFWYESSLNFY